MFDPPPVQPTTEPVQAPPHRPEHGPPPTMRCWDYADEPTLKVRINGKWQHCPVGARADYADGRVAYHVTIQMPEAGGGTHRAYWWPQDGLRRGSGSGG